MSLNNSRTHESAHQENTLSVAMADPPASRIIGQQRRKMVDILKGISDDDVIVQKLREKGIEDPEFLALFQAWSQEQEKASKQAKDSLRAQVVSEIRLARLYALGGYISEALSVFDIALNLAHYYNIKDLYDFSLAQLSELEKQYLQSV